MNEAKLVDLLGNEVTVTSYTLPDTRHFIVPATPHKYHISEEEVGYPRTMTAEIVYEGVKYVGVLTEVEEKP